MVGEFFQPTPHRHRHNPPPKPTGDSHRVHFGLFGKMAIVSSALYAIVAIAHVLASAAWFGAMFYSLSVLQPRARQYFSRDDELEEFTARLAHGSRAKVLAALGVIGVTGALLIPFTRPAAVDRRWVVLIAVKIALLVLAAVVFAVATYRLWPQRVFTPPDQLPRVRRQFLIVQVTLLTIATLAIALGVAAHIPWAP